MKFHYAGKYNDESQLERRPDPEGAVMFKEPKNMKTIAIIMNALAIVIYILLWIALSKFSSSYKMSFWGFLIFVASMVPHEFLHAICFREDVYMYTNLNKGMLFVYNTEDMSKGRFIFMSMLPNIIFGFIPLILFLIFPSVNLFGTLANFAICAGAGDYINVYHAVAEVPNGAKIYMNGFNTYWYKD